MSRKIQDHDELERAVQRQSRPLTLTDAKPEDVAERKATRIEQLQSQIAQYEQSIKACRAELEAWKKL